MTKYQIFRKPLKHLATSISILHLKENYFQNTFLKISSHWVYTKFQFEDVVHNINKHRGTLMNKLIGENTNRFERYGQTAITLHWLMAILIITLLALGYYMVDIPKGVPNRADYFNLHKSLGVLAAVLIMLRAGWRWTHPAPKLPAKVPSWAVTTAWWSHLLLYICMVLQPLTGYLSSSFNKYGVKFFGIELPKWGWEDAVLRDLFMKCHHLIAVILAALVLVHVLAAFKHLLVDRDWVFQRMLFGGNQSTKTVVE
jgi:cytochrome b561